MLTLVQYFLRAMVVTACVSIASQFSEITEPLWWVIATPTILFSLLMFDVYNQHWVSPETAARMQKYRDEDYDKLCHRLNYIKLIANRNMATGEGPRGLANKKHLVVPYDDLLTIWDVADKAKWG